MTDDLQDEFIESVVTGDQNRALAAVEKAGAGGVPAMTFVSDGFMKLMEDLTARFERGDAFLLDILNASSAFDSIIRELGIDRDNQIDCRGTVVMGTVLGDIHGIGMEICTAMLRGAGYRVIDLGTDVSPEEFAKAAETYSADIVGASAVMSTTLLAQKDVLEHIRGSGIKAMVIFGGAPCTLEWVDEIGGDGYSSTAKEIVELVNRLLRKTERPVSPRLTSSGGTQ